MLNRNNIFKTVRDTTNTLNVSTGRKIDNVYTELMEYEHMAQSRYDKIKNILETIRYHHNKIQNLNKNYNSAIFGGAIDSSLLDKIEIAINNIDILSKELESSEFDTLLINKNNVLKEKFKKGEDKDKDLTITQSDVDESDVEFFEPLVKDIQNLERLLQNNKTTIKDIFDKIKAVEKSLIEYIESKKISRDFRQSIKDGLKRIEEFVAEDKKNDSKTLNIYSTLITTGLGYSKSIKTLNEKSDKNVDYKILNEFLKNPTAVKFIIKGAGTSGEIDIPKNQNPVKINFSLTQNDYDKKSTATSKTGIATVENSELRLNFVIDISKSKTSSVYNPVSGVLLFESFINILENPKYVSYFTELIKALKTIFADYDKDKDKNKQNIKEEFDKISNKKFINPLEDDDIDEDIIEKLRQIAIPNNNNELKGGNKENNKLIEDQTVIKFKDVLNKMKERILSEMEQTGNAKTINNDTKNTSDYQNLFTTKSTITNSIITSLIQNYEKERKTVNSIEDKIKLDTKFVDYLDNLGLNLADIFKVNFNDKLAFIFFILVLHIVVYSIIESLIMNNYISDIVYIMAVYVGIYCIIMFILLLILNKYVNYRMKTLLNYLNTDFNLHLISMHIFIVFMFYIVVLILSQHIDIFVAKDEDDKLQVLYRIEVISSIIFIFSSVFVILL